MLAIIVMTFYLRWTLWPCISGRFNWVDSMPIYLIVYSPVPSKDFKPNMDDYLQVLFPWQDNILRS